MGAVFYFLILFTAFSSHFSFSYSSEPPSDKLHLVKDSTSGTGKRPVAGPSALELLSSLDPSTQPGEPQFDEVINAILREYPKNPAQIFQNNPELLMGHELLLNSLLQELAKKDPKVLEAKEMKEDNKLSELQRMMEEQSKKLDEIKDDGPEKEFHKEVLALLQNESGRLFKGISDNTKAALEKRYKDKPYVSADDIKTELENAKNLAASSSVGGYYSTIAAAKRRGTELWVEAQLGKDKLQELKRKETVLRAHAAKFPEATDDALAKLNEADKIQETVEGRNRLKKALGESLKPGASARETAEIAQKRADAADASKATADDRVTAAERAQTEAKRAQGAAEAAVKGGKKALREAKAAVQPAQQAVNARQADLRVATTKEQFDRALSELINAEKDKKPTAEIEAKRAAMNAAHLVSTAEGKLVTAKEDQRLAAHEAKRAQRAVEESKKIKALENFANNYRPESGVQPARSVAASPESSPSTPPASEVSHVTGRGFSPPSATPPVVSPAPRALCIRRRCTANPRRTGSRRPGRPVGGRIIQFLRLR